MRKLKQKRAIEAMMKLSGINQSDLAKELNVSTGQLSTVLSMGLNNDMLAAILRILGFNMRTYISFLKKARG